MKPFIILWIISFVITLLYFIYVKIYWRVSYNGVVLTRVKYPLLTYLLTLLVIATPVVNIIYISIFIALLIGSKIEDCMDSFHSVFSFDDPDNLYSYSEWSKLSSKPKKTCSITKFLFKKL